MNTAYRFTHVVGSDSEELLQLLRDWGKQSWFVRLEYLDAANSEWRAADLRMMDPRFPDVVVNQIAELQTRFPTSEIRIYAIDPSDHNFRSRSVYYRVDQNTNEII